MERLGYEFDLTQPEHLANPEERNTIKPEPFTVIIREDLIAWNNQGEEFYLIDVREKIYEFEDYN